MPTVFYIKNYIKSSQKKLLQSFYKSIPELSAVFTKVPEGLLLGVLNGNFFLLLVYWYACVHTYTEKIKRLHTL